MKKVIIIGGGAAGFFAANSIADQLPNLDILILEKTSKTLSKVKVSGGGRCNVTHQEFNPRLLSQNYPRGEKKLQNPFKSFNPKNTIEWFNQKGIKLKVESDGRMFPESNSSQTIVDCFREVLTKANVNIQQQIKITEITKREDCWVVHSELEKFEADYLIIATGSDNKMYQLIENSTQHTVIPLVPSLFTFKIQHELLDDLQGISFANAHIKLEGSKLATSGPLLITHWGISGPATLKLSAWGARDIADKNYSFKILINFEGNKSYEEISEHTQLFQEENRKKKIVNSNPFSFPKRFWERLCQYCSIDSDKVWGDLSKKLKNKLINSVSQASFEVNGKSTFKEEFVTAGGIDLSEINMKTFESDKHNNLFFAGEILNIDAITGGFNFQACWTAGHLISESIKKKENEKM